MDFTNYSSHSPWSANFDDDDNDDDNDDDKEGRDLIH